MICNCAEEIDSNSFRLPPFIRNLLNLNGNSERVTSKDSHTHIEKHLRHQLNATKCAVILSRARCGFWGKAERIWDLSVAFAFS